MPIAADIAGKRFGRLVAVAFVGRRKIGSQLKRFWRCRCDCGAIIERAAGALTTSNTTSCGCLLRETITKHGASRTPVYKIWHAMIERCRNPNLTEYNDYGGRGIHVCRQWDDFSKFLKDMGPRPAGTTLDRIDVNGNYEPSNCRWATPLEQANNRRNNHHLTFRGETLTLSEWARRFGIRKGALYHRLKSGWNLDEALMQPVDRRLHGGKRRNLR